jgi:hypothetical protein
MAATDHDSSAAGPGFAGPDRYGPDRSGPDSARAAPDPAGGPALRIQDPGELIAALPALIGFHPAESLVLIATGGRSGRRIGLTVRVDLPQPEQAGAVVADAVQGLLLDDPAGAAVVVLGAGSAGSEGDGGPPHAALAAATTAVLLRHDVAVHTLVWAARTAAGAPWACYDACRCRGVVPDPASSALAAAVVAGGQVIHRDREALHRLVEPADPGRIRRREGLLVRRLEEQAAERDSAQAVVAGLATVRAAIADCAAGRLRVDDRTVVELACALSDRDVRDAALLHNIGPDPAAAEQLWTALVRETPDPEAAAPASLLAVSALLRGDGALANVALDRAEQAWPGHRLTRLLRAAADAGMRPAQVRAWLAGSGPVSG